MERWSLIFFLGGGGWLSLWVRTSALNSNSNGMITYYADGYKIQPMICRPLPSLNDRMPRILLALANGNINWCLDTFPESICLIWHKAIYEFHSKAKALWFKHKKLTANLNWFLSSWISDEKEHFFSADRKRRLGVEFIINEGNRQSFLLKLKAGYKEF